MSGSVQIPFLLVAAAVGFGFGWFAFYRYINRTFEKRKSDWREILNHTEHEKNSLELKKDKLEKHLIDSNKLLQEKDEQMAQLEEEARAHGQQYKDMVTAYRETYTEKEGALTQQIDRLKTQANQTQVNLKTDQQEFSEESKTFAVKLASADERNDSLVEKSRELQMQVDALNAELSGSTRANEELELEVEKQKNASIGLQETLDKIRLEHVEELSIARTGLDDSRNEYRQLKDQYNEVLSIAADKEANPIVVESESSINELEELRANEDVLKDKVADLQEQVRHVEHQSRDQMANEKESNKQLKEDLEALRKENISLSAEILKLSSEAPVSAEMAAETEAEVTALQRALNDEKNRTVTLEKEAADLSHQLKEKEMVLVQEKMQASAETEQVIAGLKDSLQQTEQELEQEKLQTAAETDELIAGLKDSLQQKEQELKQEKLRATAETDELIANLKGSLQQKERDLKSVQQELLLSEKTTNAEDNSAVRDELEKLKIVFDENKADLTESTQIISNLMVDIETYRNKHLSVVSELEHLKVSDAVAQNKVLDLNKKLNPKREQDLLKKYAAADKDNVDLRQKLEALQAQLAATKTAGRDEASKATAVRVRSKTTAKKKAPRARSSKKSRDDLKLISGIGPVLEKELRKIGVSSYSDIAAWKKSDVSDVNERLDLKGRVDREEWIKQAKALIKSDGKAVQNPKRQTKRVASKPKVKRKSKPKVKKKTNQKDNLQLINGIGPALEKKLNKMGYRTFADIAALRKKQISELDAELNFKGRIEREQWVLQAREFKAQS